MFNSEPPILDDDTRPRPPIERIDVQSESLSSPVYGEVIEADAPRRGCANRLLVLFVLASFLFLCIATIGFAGVAGYRDGQATAAVYATNTQIADISTQVSHITQDIQSGRWESALARCQYVATLHPGDPGMVNCIQHAEQVLSVTPTPAATLTSAPTTPLATATILTPTSAPDVTPTVTTNPTEALLLDLWTRAQETFRQNQYETARGYLEALQEADKTYNAHDVVAMLCSTYESLGNIYQNPAQVSQMVVVMNKALGMNCTLQRTDWAFTVNAAELYLDAKGYLVAGDYSRADTVFKRFMALASGYLDGKAYACQAFNKTGDSAAIQTYCH
ncbi:MAG: tetratricopeptide repeat protein [Aggregatilineales bacterium]